ncbi:aminodeoxychorismate synthase component I [Ammonifex thiophilus]|uniref:aminodeoxychorismate synthase n=1 Tax=Ammonifex thiophilus TaxID=444093 RepID=A0A3D8P3X5_9THEO|nr:aminodeoxychorismate synthase component I [Ammonifex thiophilus]RDV82308.1 aminodeoxychorismate synthase component I [Ammonifex thiophilus]
MPNPLIMPLPVKARGAEIFAPLAHLPMSILLESALVVPGFSRYSFIMTKPFLQVQAKGQKLVLRDEEGREWTEEGNPLELLRNLLRHYQYPSGGCPLPFCGGAAGFISYDLGRQLERLPSRALDDLSTPDFYLGFYDTALVVDELSREVFLVATGLPEKEPRQAQKRALARAAELSELIRNITPLPPPRPLPAQECPLYAHFDASSYCEAVIRAKEYIAAGDIFQVNLSQRFSLPRLFDPREVYLRLRAINPAPMAAYLNLGEWQIVSASPERFLQVRNGRVETRPIKGTRPRGSDPVNDARMREELWHSEKDRAELTMIVDLERNDLGKVCRPGSVRVPELFRLEEYATVFHLVATVQGELAPGKDLVDLIKAAFPGGSITGAPKIRAMEIIEELEPVRRGIYTGSIGYLGFDGNADLSIVIRTLIFRKERVYFQVGGGITSDSDPYAEYLETLDKARALVRAMGFDEEKVFRSLVLEKPGKEEGQPWEQPCSSTGA